VAIVLLFAILTAQSQAAWPFGSSKKKAGSVVLPPKDAKAKAQPAKAEAAAQGGSNASTQMVRRAHLHFDDAAAEDDFLRYSGARRRVQEDLTVITRLMQEKKMELERFSNDLSLEFAISPEGNYQYDDQTDVIYELVRKPSADGATNAVADFEKDFDKQEHMKLDDQEKRTRFLRLVASKKLSGEELQILQLLQNEKDIEATTLQQQLVARYAISNDREYRYERSTRTLYELVPVPRGTASTAPEAQEAVTK
jgi:hypothetical protein